MSIVTPAESLNGGPKSEPVVQIVGLSKTFPGQKALADVSMEVRPAEIHALLGQNGSGKSTLIKILAGIYTPDPDGVVRVSGEELPFGSPRDSRRMGLQFVHQALGIIEDLTAVENVALGFGYRHRAKFLIDWPAQRKKTKRLLDKLSVEFDINCPVSALRPVDRSAIAIARALDDDDGAIQVLVLDEPTAALPPHEVDALFSLVRQARNNGTSVIYVSHRLNEIFELADRATVLRDGKCRGTVMVSDIDHAELVTMIVGNVQLAPSDAPGEQASAGPARQSAKVALRVRGLEAQRLNGVDFEVKVGEIVGVAGLTGSGREELAGALVGERPSHVSIENVDGKTVSDPTPRQAKSLGLVLVLPNRAAGAATAEFTIQENITLPSLSRYSVFGLIRQSAEMVDAKRWIGALDIRPNDPERVYALLSGGNQQKAIFGKWLNLGPKVMVIDDPTSGVDIGARKAIYDLIRHQASQGVSFIVCSSDSDDLLAVCDRILVLDEGDLVDQLVGTDIEESRLLTAMVGNKKERSENGALLRKAGG
jgi:ribose transport system ATP-binding protein